jgi:uncharacterized protein YjdB
MITTATLTDGKVGMAYSQTLTATSAYNLPVTWSILSGSLPGGLSLEPNTGVVSGTPTAAGTFIFTIQAANGGPTPVTKQFSIVITAEPPVPIGDAPGVDAPVDTGATVDLPKSIDFGDGTNADVTWTSGDPSIARVDKDGNLIAVGEGKVTLTATTKDGRKQTVTITIAKPVTTIRTPLKTLYLKKGTALTPPVCADSVNPITKKASTTAKLTWKSSKPKVATVDAKGKIKAKKTGTAKITATALNGKKLTINIKVVKKAVALKKPTLTKPPKSMKAGKTAILKLKATPSKATNLNVKFSSSNKKVLTVDKAGKLTALKKGKAKITVKIGKKKYVKAIEVTGVAPLV